ncbi:MAG: hypothetical protein D4R65_11260 [Verrucomicrobiaceae bacterium]|nr:MAG: hypothetical protein D4R65_11260 [Verrucomicrobiaceae bacterium]
MRRTNFLLRKWNTLSGLFLAAMAGEPSEVLRAAMKGQVESMPNPAKRATLRYYGNKYAARTFVETGTFRGDTIAFLEPYFDSLYSVELSMEFYLAAQKRFEAMRDKIHIHQGDSAIELAGILMQVRGRTLVWLDAHCSGKDTARGETDTPIMAELELIGRQSLDKHIILIDDTRGFGIDPAYPDLQAIADFAQKQGYHFESRFDILRLVPFELRA